MGEFGIPWVFLGVNGRKNLARDRFEDNLRLAAVKLKEAFLGALSKNVAGVRRSSQPCE
jgi:hypothetical protein